MVVAALAGGLLCLCPVLAESLPLRWAMPPGQELRVRWHQTLRTEIQGEQTVGWTLRAAAEMRWRVDAVDQDGTLQMSHSFTRFILQTTSADGSEVIYDTASDEQPPFELREIARAVKPLLERRFTVAMSPRGRFQAVHGDEPSRAASGESAVEPWAALLSPAGWERAFGQSLGRLPEGPVQPGDQWQHRETLETPQGPLRVEHSYRYEGTVPVESGALEVIRVVTEATAGPPPGAFDPPQPPGQRQTGIYHFDAKAGFLVQSDLVQTRRSEVPDSEPPLRIEIQGRLRTQIKPWPRADDS